MDSFEKYVGQVFDKRYRIIKVIGIGGMAVVFEAADLLMRRNVAVKMLKDDINNDTQAVKRFINESKAVAMLSHPNIVNIYDVSVKDNLKYIVMELVEGITLKNYILKKGVLGFNEMINITEQILLALDHAHQKGIVHRDIKPQNIMMLKNGVIKVADFGIAKLPNAETVTMSDKAIGTVFYISPEQASGKQIDRRSDIYSLGVTMYEMATGKLPFVADSPVTVALMQVKNRPKPPRELNPALPVGLEQIILGAMEKNPDSRFQSAAQMLRHVAQVKSNPKTVFRMPKPEPSSDAMINQDSRGLPPNVKKLSTDNRKRASRSMSPVIAGVVSAFLVVFIISAIVCITQITKKSEEEESAFTQLTVDKYVGEIYTGEEMKSMLASEGYNVIIKQVHGTKYDRNEIIAQDPLPGEKRKINLGRGQLCDLTLTVCAGPETCELPDFSYEDWRVAENQLKDNFGLQVTVEKEFHEFISAGYVIRTEPVPGTTLRVGDTVILYVSSGQDVELVAVPNFYKCDEPAVMKMLGWSKLELGEVSWEHSDDVNKGCVIRQSRPATGMVATGTKIDFVMSLGPEPVETAAPQVPDTPDDGSGDGAAE